MTRVQTRAAHFARCGAFAALLAAACAANADDQDTSSPTVRACVYHPNIDHTRILDDRNILFFMRDHTVFQNSLKDQCYSLAIHGRFTYGTASMHRLCAGNLISVVDDVTLGGVNRNSPCKLGLFVPVDREVADDMIAAAKAARYNKGARSELVKTVPVAPPAQPEPASVRADDPPSTARRCVYVERIDRTRIVDGKSIVFFMRDRTVLQNVLRRPCPALRPNDGIRYEVTIGQLCADEFVTQLIDGGSGRPGALCQIGMFVPIGEDEAQRLLPPRRSARGRATTKDVASQPVELPAPAASEPDAR